MDIKPDPLMLNFLTNNEDNESEEGDLEQNRLNEKQSKSFNLNRNQRRKVKRDNETVEEREARNELQRQKRLQETDEQKRINREKAKLRMRERRKNETSEEKFKRLELKRLKNLEKSEEKRQLESEKEKLRRQKRLQNLNEEQMALLREKRRAQKQKIRETESEKQKTRQRQQNKLLHETIEERELRLEWRRMQRAISKKCSDETSLKLILEDLTMLELVRKEELILTYELNYHEDPLSLQGDPLSIKSEKNEQNVIKSNEKTDLLRIPVEVEFKRESSVELEISIDHQNTSQNAFKCSFCAQTFEYRSTLILHELQHKPRRKCLVCFQNIFEDKYEEHRKIHQKMKFFCCDICKERFSYEISFKNHLKEHQAEKLDVTKFELKVPAVFKCAHCRECFAFKVHLIDHLFCEHLRKREENCPQCQFASHSKSLLEAHMLIHYKPATIAAVKI